MSRPRPWRPLMGALQCRLVRLAEAEFSMRARMTMLALGMLFAGAASAAAGGDGYDAVDDTAGNGPVFFGVVRDTRGLGVSDAEVILQARQGEPVKLRTNILGVYRSHVETDAAPAEVVVTCGKPGYRQAAVVRRLGQNPRISEINCTLQRL